MDQKLIKYFNKINSVATKEDILAIEEKVGFKLPKDYTEFLMNFGNGGLLNSNYIHLFYNETKIDQETSILDFISTNELFDLCLYWKENLWGLMCIAETVDDDVIVFYLDHSKPGYYVFSGDFGFEKIADTIYELFENIHLIEEKYK